MYATLRRETWLNLKWRNVVIRKLENFIFFLILISVPMMVHFIVKEIPRLSSQYKGYVVLMVTFVSIGFAIMGDIKAVDAEQMEFYEFYLKLFVYAISLLFWGFVHRHTVLTNFRKTYYTTMAGYTYVIFATGVLMHWVSPVIHIT